MPPYIADSAPLSDMVLREKGFNSKNLAKYYYIIVAQNIGLLAYTYFCVGSEYIY